MVVKAERIFSKFMNWRLDDSPEFASFIGKACFNDRLESYSPSENAKRKETCLQFLSEAKALEAKAEGNAKKSLRLFIYDLECFLNGYDFSGYGAPVNYFEGPQADFAQILSYMPKESKTDFENILARYKAFSVQADQIIEMLNYGISKKSTNHISSMKNVVNQFAKLQVPVETSDFYKPFLSIPNTVPAEERAALQSAVQDVLQNCFLPAMKKLETFIEKEYLPNCRATIGANTMPRGEKYYQLCLDFHLSCHMSPQEVHDLGLAEVKRISIEMKKVIEGLGDDSNIQEFSEKIRLDPQFFYKHKDDLLQGYQQIVKDEILPKLPNIFKSIPKAELSIESLPSSMSGGPLAYYLAGSFDGKRPGVFYVNTANINNSPKYEMRSLALHEGLPGHHLQTSFVIELPDLPEFQRFIEDRKYFSCPARFPQHSAYIEGWGLYCEYLGKELGIYKDPYSLLGQLSQEIFRACRLVVDTGIHSFGWSVEQAVDFMLKHSSSTKENVEKEVTRYIMWPGQACAYKVGEIKIKSLRGQAEQLLGTKFCLKEFHDVVLRNMGPLSFLEEEVNKYINEALSK